MIVNLHGKRISGRYALIQTNGDQWLAHRMKEQQAFDFDTLAPMLTTHGSVDRLKAGQWAFEGKWDGYRLLVEADHGAVRLRSRSGRDVTKEYPQLRSLAADLADHHVVLDGEVVALDAAGVPSFNEMQNRVRPPASSSGHSTCSTSTAARCCVPSTRTGASCWKPWAPQAISLFRSCCPVTEPRPWLTRANAAGRV